MSNLFLVKTTFLIIPIYFLILTTMLIAAPFVEIVVYKLPYDTDLQIVALLLGLHILYKLSFPFDIQLFVGDLTFLVVFASQPSILIMLSIPSLSLP